MSYLPFIVNQIRLVAAIGEGDGERGGAAEKVRGQGATDARELLPRRQATSRDRMLRTRAEIRSV